MNFSTLEKRKPSIDNNNGIGLKERIKNKLYPVLIWGNSLMPMASTTTSTVNTISAPIATTITLGTAAGLLTACGGEDGPDSPIETKDTTPPTITVSHSSVDITGGKEIHINGNQLYIGDILVASRNDNQTKNCKVSLSINGKSVSSGTTITEKGTLTIKVTDDAGNIKSTDIQLNVGSQETPISGLESIKNIPLQVDQEVNLLEGVTFGNGASLVKVQIEQNGQITDIADPQHYIPEYPGNCNIILIVKDKQGNTSEYKVDNLNIKALEYQSPEIKYLQAKEILPITGKINSGDPKAYEHINHLKIAEGTLMRDMMRKYGAGKYSPEEYQQLMLRLNTGTIGEKPLGYDNYELVGEDFHDESRHGHNTRDILNTIIKHSNLKVLEDYENAMDELYAKQPKNSINIFGTSRSLYNPSKDSYNQNNTDYNNLKKYLNKDNFIRFCSGLDLVKLYNIFRNKLVHEDFNLPDENSVYGTPISHANSKNDTNIDKHMFVTIGTNKSGNVDISNSDDGSNFPVGFHPKVLFSGRAFPYNTLEGNVHGEDGNYETSYTNYANLAMTDLCFQMKADTPNGPTLMSMILDTSLTDQIHLDGQTQELHLINPAGFIKKYLMPTAPSDINEGTTITLEKGFYKGIIFDIPGAEVNINGEWIPYNKNNQSLIKSQNPFNLKWRLNGKLAKKMGYSQSNPIKGKIIISDDKFNGLDITQDVSINIK